VRHIRSTRRDFIGGALALTASTAVAPGGLAGERTILNDASRLNPTPVAKHWRVQTGDGDGFIAGLRSELAEAAAAKRPVAVGAARHSMGGQSLPRDGAAITLSGRVLQSDVAARTYLASAGARWADVIRTLDPLGFSPAVMQSNNDFGVGSTYCVNAHGWPVPYGPFGSTVRSLRMMLADGSIVECSRSKNSELFSLSMGGYGLFGIILDLELDMAPNMLLAPKVEIMKGREFASRFAGALTSDPAIRMAYGRLSVARSAFFEEAVMVTYRAALNPPSSLPPATGKNFLTTVSRDIYRAQIGNETAKKARWIAETRLNPALSSGVATRNTLMNEPVSNLAGHDRRRTDILHEYFIPPQQFPAFIADCREIIPPARAEFLNVTLRYVGADETAALAFAPAPRIAAVMSFSQEISPEGEVEMIQITERLIDRAINLGGAFYLPYRLHARRDQVRAAYPRADEFAERKRFYDPKLLFRNAMWDAYFA
jgi:FAD/FMN-containing dehydrogenase